MTADVSRAPSGHGLSVREIDPADGAVAGVVWLHGIGQDPSSLTAVATRLKVPEMGFRGAFPEAPVLGVGEITGAPVRAWYEVSVFALDKADMPGLVSMADRLDRLIAQECERVGSERLVVAGFSQGAVMALALGLRYPERLGALALYAPFMPPEVEALLEAERTDANAELPVWIGHGARDMVTPEYMGHHVRDSLIAWGHPVTFQRYAGGHEPFGGVQRSLTDFLAATFDGLRIPDAVPET